MSFEQIKNFALHPVCFALSPFLFLLSYNSQQVAISEAWLPALITLAVTVLLIILLDQAVKSIQKTCIVISFVLLAFFSYGRVYGAMPGFLENVWGGGYLFLLLLYILILTPSIRFILTSKSDLRVLTGFLNITSVALVTISVFQIVCQSGGHVTLQNHPSEQMEGQSANAGRTSPARDIYYIILDGYANSKTLKEFYGYDNSEFIQFLTQKGFYVASDSRSNYVITFLSLASSLNMEYLEDLGDLPKKSKDRAIPYDLIKKNRVVSFLKSKGYMYVHFSSGWGPTNHNEYADLNFQCGVLDEFLLTVLQTTMLRPFQHHFTKDLRAKVLCSFSNLAELHKIKGPKFIFAHIKSPHPPYLFDANGGEVANSELQLSGHTWQQKKKYLDQLIFISRKTKDLIDEILSKSPSPPIIILQSDHGSASSFSKGTSDSWNKPTLRNLNERFRILNAYYLPDGDKRALYSQISPVNSFRVVFNKYFDTNYSLLDDKTYFSNYKRPYKLKDVTSRFSADILVK